MRVRYLVAAFSAGTVLAVACVLPRYEADRADGLGAQDGGGEDSAIEAQVEDSLADQPQEPSDPRPCDDCKDPALLRAPCRPDMPDPQAPSEALLFAARTVRYGVRLDDTEGTKWRTIGIDLDCLATGKDGTPTQCKLAEDAGIAPLVASAEDGEQGRDNSFGSNFGNLMRTAHKMGSAQPDEEVATNERWEQGEGGLLVQLSGLDKGADDPSVQVAILSTGGTVGADGGREAPAWDGEDTWAVTSGSMLNNSPKYFDDHAYVTGNTVVAKLLTIPLQFGPAGALILRVSHATLLLQLNAEHTKIVDGTMAGTWLTSEATAMMDLLLQQGCVSATLRETATRFLQASSDVRHDLQPAPGVACDAVSFSFGFTAELAKLGETIDEVPAPPLDGGCDSGP